MQTFLVKLNSSNSLQLLVGGYFKEMQRTTDSIKKYAPSGYTESFHPVLIMNNTMIKEKHIINKIIKPVNVTSEYS